MFQYSCVYLCQRRYCLHEDNDPSMTPSHFRSSFSSASFLLKTRTTGSVLLHTTQSDPILSRIVSTRPPKVVPSVDIGRPSGPVVRNSKCKIATPHSGHAPLVPRIHQAFLWFLCIPRFTRHGAHVSVRVDHHQCYLVKGSENIFEPRVKVTCHTRLLKSLRFELFAMNQSFAGVFDLLRHSSGGTATNICLCESQGTVQCRPDKLQALIRAMPKTRIEIANGHITKENSMALASAKHLRCNAANLEYFLRSGAAFADALAGNKHEKRFLVWQYCNDAAALGSLLHALKKHNQDHQVLQKLQIDSNKILTKEARALAFSVPLHTLSIHAIIDDVAPITKAISVRPCGTGDLRLEILSGKSSESFEWLAKRVASAFDAIQTFEALPCRTIRERWPNCLRCSRLTQISKMFVSIMALAELTMSSPSF